MEGRQARRAYFLIRAAKSSADPRVRKALDYAFDFEWTNKSLFYGLYTRTASYFENSDLKAEGKPSPAELALLEPFRDQLSPEVFEEVYSPPVTDASGRYRPSVRTASKLLDDAGWRLQDGVRKNAKGETLDIEFLIDDPVTERIVNPYAGKLKDLGIRASLRRVDPAQEQELLKRYEFDAVSRRYSFYRRHRALKCALIGAATPGARMGVTTSLELLTLWLITLSAKFSPQKAAKSYKPLARP